MTGSLRRSCAGDGDDGGGSSSGLQLGQFASRLNPATSRQRASSLSVAAISTSGGMKPAVSVPGEGGKQLDFFEYATETFASIREALGLHPAEYVGSTH